MRIYRSNDIFSTVIWSTKYINSIATSSRGKDYDFQCLTMFSFTSIFFYFQSLEALNPMGFYFFINLVTGVSLVLPYCYGATYTLISLERNSKKVYNFLWYKLPPKQQYHVRFLMQFAQREREMRGFGLIPCAISTFLRVMVARII